MLPYLTEDFGNPSSAHEFGATGRLALKEARERVRALIGAAFRERDPVHFGRDGGRQTAIRGALGHRRPQRNHRLRGRASGGSGAVLASRTHASRQGSPHSVDPSAGSTATRYRAALSRSVALVIDHVGQQRDRRRLPGRGAGGGGQGGRRAVPYRRRAGGRAHADRPCAAPQSTCCRSRRTSCTGRRASARSTCGAARRFVR